MHDWSSAVTPDRIRLAPYAPSDAARWNAFVERSRNGTFLFDRGYMDYHADRFVDASFIAFAGDGDDDLVALLPASRHDRRLVSHGGLSYGGWITDERMTSAGMLRLFDLLAEDARKAGFDEMSYKAIPRCHHRLPADEDLHALFARGATPVRQDLSSVVDLADAPAWAKMRRRALAKSRAEGVEVVQSSDFSAFVVDLAGVLERHGATPVHSAAELELLAGRFPDRIRLYEARRAAEAVAYALVYDCGQTVHTQYLVNTKAGRVCGGLEAIVDVLQNRDYADRRYLSFGISTEQEGRVLNEGLIAQKEMFGGRAMICPFYTLRFDR